MLRLLKQYFPIRNIFFYIVEGFVIFSQDRVGQNKKASMVVDAERLTGPGWTQVLYNYGATIDDAMEKLQGSSF